MYLVNIYTLRLQKFGERPPPYATLSHRWMDEETTYGDFIDETRRKGAGFEKIRSFCRLLRQKSFYQLGARQRVRWCWVDTCCIDKRSSAELSEAINSMAKNYERSAFCVAYLNDVEVINNCPRAEWEDQVRKSEWFRRGWTLQELLFPPRVVFCDRYWRSIPGFDTGRKETRKILSQITEIPSRCFGDGTAISRCSVGSRMKWASRRSTTRIEDRAYSLLGLFGISMPLLYGEGEKAFYRLQEQIIGRYDDETILCWTSNSYPFYCPVLASSPDDFFGWSSDPVILWEWEQPPMCITNRGLEIKAAATQLMWPGQQKRSNEFVISATQFVIISLNACSCNHKLRRPWYIALARHKYSRYWYRCNPDKGLDSVWDHYASLPGINIKRLSPATYYIASTPDRAKDAYPFPRNHPKLGDLFSYESLTERFAGASEFSNTDNLVIVIVFLLTVMFW